MVGERLVPCLLAELAAAASGLKRRPDVRAWRRLASLIGGLLHDGLLPQCTALDFVAATGPFISDFGSRSRVNAAVITARTMAKCSLCAILRSLVAQAPGDIYRLLEAIRDRPALIAVYYSQTSALRTIFSSQSIVENFLTVLRALTKCPAGAAGWLRATTGSAPEDHSCWCYSPVLRLVNGGSLVLKNGESLPYKVRTFESIVGSPALFKHSCECCPVAAGIEDDSKATALDRTGMFVEAYLRCGARSITKVTQELLAVAPVQRHSHDSTNGSSISLGQWIMLHMRQGTLADSVALYFFRVSGYAGSSLYCVGSPVLDTKCSTMLVDVLRPARLLELLTTTFNGMRMNGPVEEKNVTPADSKPVGVRPVASNSSQGFMMDKDMALAILNPFRSMASDPSSELKDVRLHFVAPISVNCSSFSSENGKDSLDLSITKIGFVLASNQSQPSQIETQSDGSTKMVFKKQRVVITLHSRLNIVDDYIHIRSRSSGMINKPSSSPDQTQSSVFRLSLQDANFHPDKPLERNTYCPSCKVELDRDKKLFCNYSGLFYCAKCHVHDRVVIPARAIHHADCALYEVSVSSLEAIQSHLLDVCIRTSLLPSDVLFCVPELCRLIDCARTISRFHLYYSTCEQCRNIVSPLFAMKSYTPDKIVMHAKKNDPLIVYELDRSYLLDFKDSISLVDFFDCCVIDNAGGLINIIENIEHKLIEHVNTVHKINQ